jgi:hypothetical protein
LYCALTLCRRDSAGSKLISFTYETGAPQEPQNLVEAFKGLPHSVQK